MTLLVYLVVAVSVAVLMLVGFTIHWRHEYRHYLSPDGMNYNSGLAQSMRELREEGKSDTSIMLRHNIDGLQYISGCFNNHYDPILMPVGVVVALVSVAWPIAIPLLAGSAAVLAVAWGAWYGVVSLSGFLADQTESVVKRLVRKLEKVTRP